MLHSYNIHLIYIKKVKYIKDGIMRKIRWWIECKFFNKHKYNIYTKRCFICDRLQEDEAKYEQQSQNSDKHEGEEKLHS